MTSRASTAAACTRRRAWAGARGGAWLLVLLCCGEAEASKPRLRLERVDATTCRENQRVRAYVSEVELEGVLRERPPLEYRLLAGDTVVAARPAGATRFAKLGEPLRVAVVVEAGAAYRDDLPAITAAAATLVAALPAGSPVSVFNYAGTARRLVTGGTREAGRRALQGMHVDASSLDLVLVDALRMALRELVAAGSAMRRVLVAVSDGMDRQPDWETFRAIGRQAAQHGIPIFPVAYSSIDERGPLLNLGELAKRSHGTLRWARGRADIGRAFDDLAREINQQLVLTFHHAGCAAGDAVQVAAGGLRSNRIEPVIRQSTAGTGSREGRPWWWTGAIVALVVASGAALAWVTRLLVKGMR